MTQESPHYDVAGQTERIVITFSDLKRLSRPALVTLIPLVLGAVATFRSFGFDYGEDGVKGVYPYLADGWGIWYWFGQLRFNFYFFFFVVNLIFAGQILLLAFPRRPRTFSLSVSVVTVLYMVFWFLFGQSRYGMAIGLVAAAAATGSIPAVLILGVLATLIHKAAVGGVALAVLWLALQRMRFGLATAACICALFTYLVVVAFKNLLLFVGYGNYLGWSSLPAANTPLKFYYVIAILVLWKILDRRAPNNALILSLLFLPFSYFIVFAGRAFEFYAVLLLPYLGRSGAPKYVRYPILLLFLADLSILLFTSGFYF